MSELKKELSFFGLTMIAIGATIGSGIFLTPAGIAQKLQTPPLILLVWVLGGLIALTGALTLAELGGMFPRAGGIYVFLKEAYGKPVAFLYGWMQLLISNTGSIAALCLAFAKYVNFLMPMGSNGQLGVSLFALVFATTVNIFGVKMGEIFSNIFTAGKLLGIAVVVVAGFIFAGKELGNMDFSLSQLPPDLSSAFALSLIGVLWSYGGWQHTSFLAGEAKDASRNIPRAMILGAAVVTLVYVFVNVVYLCLLPGGQLAASDAVAADAMSKIFPWGGTFIALVIAVSTFGTLNIYTLSVPRIYYAMAKDGIFFSSLADLHPRYGTPVRAILIQSVWTLVLLFFWRTFDNLITYVAFMDWIFFLLAGVSIFIFRKKMPDAPRPYRTWLYPLTPIIFVSIVVWFLGYTLVGKPEQAGAGLVVLAIGLLFYYFFNRKNKAKN